MNKRITFKNPTTTKSATGGSVTTYSAWEDSAAYSGTVWASVKMLNENRNREGSEVKLQASFEFIVRYQNIFGTLLTSDTWIRYDLNDYQITTIFPKDLDGYVKILAVSVQGSSAISSGGSTPSGWKTLPDGPGYGTMQSTEGTEAELEAGDEDYSYQINLSSVGNSVISLKNNWRTVIDWGDGSPLMSYANATVYKTYAYQSDIVITVYYKAGKTEALLFMQGGANLNLPATAVVDGITGTLPPLTWFRIGYGLPSIPVDFLGATYVDVGGASLDQTELNDLIQLLVETGSQGTGRYLKMLNQTTEATPTNFTGIDLLLARQWEVQGYAAPTGATVTYDGTTLTFIDGNQNAETEISIGGESETTLPVGTHTYDIVLPAGANSIGWRYTQGGTTTAINTQIITV
jgi:SPP1 family predicted phage head-tail adaptor